MTRKLYLFTFLFCLSCCLPVWAQHLNFRNYATDLVANGTVYHILQDSRGFLWFATESGVVRFDGQEYQQFTMDDGLTENEILKIYEDSRKRIWFLTLSGRLSYFYEGKFYNHTNDKTLKAIGFNSTFSTCFEDSQQNLWFSGVHNRYLKISRNGQISKYSFGDVSQGRESFFHEDADKQLIMGCKSGFYEIHQNRAVLKKLPYRPNIPRSIHITGKGEVLFLAQEGLIHMQGSRQKILIPASHIPADHSLSFMYLDNNQDLWITSTSNGVYQYKNLFHNPGKYLQHLPGKIITGLIQDAEQNLWFSSAGEGVFMLPAHFLNGRSYTRSQGLSDDKIQALTVDRFDQIWLGFNGGLLNVISPQGLRSYKLQWFKGHFPWNRIREIQADSAGNIWLGSDHGLAVLKLKAGPAYLSSFFYRPDSSAISVKSLSLSRNNQEVYITQSAGIEKLSLGKQASPYTQWVTDLPKMRTYTNFIDHAGILWFANVNGINRFDQKGLTNYGKNHPLLTSRITDIIETPGHQLVLATYGNGLLFFKNGKLLKQVTTAHGLPENICKKLFIRGNTLWVATNKGLGKVLLAADKYFTGIESYTVSDGLIGNEVNDIFADDKYVYIATAKGLDIIPNKPFTQRSSPPIIQFTSITVRNKALDISKPVSLAPDHNRMLFKFTAITFQDPENVSYQYRLDPQTQWVTTSNNSVELSAIEPGAHRFEVRAKKSNSAWSPAIAFRFAIQPAFWQTWWFWSLLTLLLLIGMALGVRLYISLKLRQQMRHMETEYRLQQERERIARDLHDNVGSHLAYIINSLEEVPGQDHRTDTAHQQDLRDFTKQTITQLRETIWAIRQETLSTGELATKIQQLLWQISQLRPDFVYEVKSEGDLSTQLTPVQALNLFRIAQEAINNVLQHSLSPCVLVRLQVRPGSQLEMRIEDKGQGFDVGTQVPEGHYGMLNMQHRAQELGAVLTISSMPGQGTLITLKLHLK